MEKFLLTKTGKIRQDVINHGLMRALTGQKTCTVYQSGHGKNARYTYSALPDLLDSLGLHYETGNDAPRGGQLGNFIVCPKNRQTARKRKILSILAEKMELPAIFDKDATVKWLACVKIERDRVYYYFSGAYDEAIRKARELTAVSICSSKNDYYCRINGRWQYRGDWHSYALDKLVKNKAETGFYDVNGNLITEN